MVSTPAYQPYRLDVQVFVTSRTLDSELLLLLLSQSSPKQPKAAVLVQVPVFLYFNLLKLAQTDVLGQVTV